MWALGQAGFYDLSQGLRGNRQSKELTHILTRGRNHLLDMKTQYFIVLSPTFPTICVDRKSGLGVNEATVHIRAVTCSHLKALTLGNFKNTPGLCLVFVEAA